MLEKRSFYTPGKVFVIPASRAGRLQGFDEVNRTSAWQQRLLQYAFLNLFLVAALGLLMRGYSFFNHFPFAYKNLVHAHSHFAFGGWITPVLVWLVMQYFPAVREKVAFHHWRNIILLTLVSAYGMLASFPFHGYAPVSIVFSTLSVLAGYYLVIVLWKATAGNRELPVRFLRAALFYLAISAIGPFATGPLIVMGKAGTPLYLNVIYFYLHFQYNGFFSFVILAVLYKILGERNAGANGDTVFRLLNLTCVPAYFLSVLWSRPPIVFYWVGGLAALLQFVALVYLLADVKKAKMPQSFTRTLMMLASAAFALKIALQLLGSFPYFADLAYQNRNFIIAYLHLVLLGFISLFAMAFVLHAFQRMENRFFRQSVYTFLFTLFITESLLVVQASGSFTHFSIPYFTPVLFYASCLFPVAALGMYGRVRRF